MSYEFEKTLLPEFPRTLHLPLEPNATSDDKIASAADLKSLLGHPQLFIEEKVDGANSGIMLWQGQPVIRNRNYILNKAYSRRKTPAQMQFSAIWTWFYNNQKKLERLEEILGFVPGVYGEWLYAQATVRYRTVPDWFVAYDVYDHASKQFACPTIARSALAEAGFTVVPLVASGQFSAEELLGLRDGDSAFGGTPREGIFVRAGDGERLTARYKMVAPWFRSSHDWNKGPLRKNLLSRAADRL